MNTINLPRSDWEMVTFALDMFIDERNLQGGSMSCILHNIHSQLDNQEY